jgi:hypothetical protein
VLIGSEVLGGDTVRHDGGIIVGTAPTLTFLLALYVASFRISPAESEGSAAQESEAAAVEKTAASHLST